MGFNLPKFNNLKALIVEDNPINRKMLKHTLKNIGILADIAENGQIGFDMAKKFRYDIIFMDIQMPVMNGIEATKAIIKYERDNKIEHTPIIAVTANALKGDRDRYLKEGMDEYIPKPIILDKFFSILRDILADKILADKKRALIYRETKIEARILEEIVKQLDFEIIISDSVDELIENIEYESFDILLTDRVKPDIVHEQIGKRLEEKSIPSILFIDKDTVVSGIDKARFSLIKDKFTNYNDIKDSLNSLIK
jgi:CheY-like chemotaxis protein